MGKFLASRLGRRLGRRLRAAARLGAHALAPQQERHHEQRGHPGLANYNATLLCVNMVDSGAKRTVDPQKWCGEGTKGVKGAEE